MPNISGGFWDLIGSTTNKGDYMGAANGAFYTNYYKDENHFHKLSGNDVGIGDGIGFNASRSNNKFSKSSTVQPQSMRVFAICRT